MCDPADVSDTSRREISPLLKALFGAPGWFYRHRMGRLLGRRFLALTHVGRTSGREFVTVLEVAVYDAEREESIVASAYGSSADWYRNILASPAVRIQTGSRDYRPIQRFLSPEEARQAAERFCAEHPWESKLAPRVLPAIGADVAPGTDAVDMLSSLPMVGFRPE